MQSISVNIFDSPVPELGKEVPIDQIQVKNGQLVINGQTYSPRPLGDERNEFVGIGFTENGMPYVLMRWQDEEHLWDWDDIMLMPAAPR